MRGTLPGEHQVPEPVVAVDHSVALRVRPVRFQPLGQLRHLRQIPCGAHVPQRCKPCELPFQVPLGASDSGDVAATNVHSVQPHQHVHGGLTRGAALGGRVQVCRNYIRDDVALHMVHHVKRHAKHVLIRAHGQDFRHRDTQRRQQRLNVRLPDHVMRGRRQRWPWSSAKHDVGPLAFDPKRHVGLAPTDAAGVHGPGSDAVGIEEFLHPFQN